MPTAEDDMPIRPITSHGQGLSTDTIYPESEQIDGCAMSAADSFFLFSTTCPSCNDGIPDCRLDEHTACTRQIEGVRATETQGAFGLQYLAGTLLRNTQKMTTVQSQSNIILVVGPRGQEHNGALSESTYGISARRGQRKTAYHSILILFR